MLYEDDDGDFFGSEPLFMIGVLNYLVRLVYLGSDLIINERQME